MNTLYDGSVGEIVEVRRSGVELHLEWRIPGIFDLSFSERDELYSPRFVFYNARWHLEVRPDCIFGFVSLSLDLRRDNDNGGPSNRRVIYSWGFRGSGGGVEWRREEEERQFVKGGRSYLGDIGTRWELREQKDRLMPGDTLVIACVMKLPGTTIGGFKDTNGFKFRTPIRNSPIMFNFGDNVCTTASTMTTSSFTFGLATSQSQTTTSTTVFKFGVPSSTSTSSFLSSTASKTNKTQINKDTVNASCSQVHRDTVNEIPVVGKDSATESNAVSGKKSVNEGSTPVAKDVEENKAQTVGDDISKSLTAKSSETVSEQSETNSERQMSNSVITNISSETSVSKVKEGVTPTVTACFSFTTQPLLDSKKSETFLFGGISPKEKLSSSSLSSLFGAFTSPSISKDKSTGCEKSLQLESKSTIVSPESKIIPALQFTTQPQQVSSGFTVLSSAPGFQFGEKVDSSKTHSTTISVAPTSTTNACFSFSNNKSNTISVSESKDIKLSRVTSETVSPFVETEVTVTTSTTTNTLLFGSTTTTSAPTAFSFSPSSLTTTTMVMSPLFTFSASSNNVQISKRSTTTSTTNIGFSFSNNKSNPISVSQSKDTKLSRVTSENVSPFVKTEIPVTTSTTTNTLLFGSTTTTSAPTAFSSFLSSVTTTTTSMSSLFNFSASSNNVQRSKPGDASTQTEDEFKEARVDDKQSSEKRDASTQTEDEVKEVRVDDKQFLEKRGQPQSSDECDICCEAPIDCGLNPCGHTCWCYNCALRFWEAGSPRCPMCRKSIQTILKLYRK